MLLILSSATSAVYIYIFNSLTVWSINSTSSLLWAPDKLYEAFSEEPFIDLKMVEWKKQAHINKTHIYYLSDEILMYRPRAVLTAGFLSSDASIIFVVSDIFGNTDQNRKIHICLSNIWMAL